MLHVDSDNVGPSMAITLGSCSGGQLNKLYGPIDYFDTSETGQRTAFHGHAPHCVMPFRRRAGVADRLYAYGCVYRGCPSIGLT